MIEIDGDVVAFFDLDGQLLGSGEWKHFRESGWVIGVVVELSAGRHQIAGLIDRRDENFGHRTIYSDGQPISPYIHYVGRESTLEAAKTVVLKRFDYILNILPKR